MISNIENANEYKTRLSDSIDKFKRMLSSTKGFEQIRNRFIRKKKQDLQVLVVTKIPSTAGQVLTVSLIQETTTNSEFRLLFTESIIRWYKESV